MSASQQGRTIELNATYAMTGYQIQEIVGVLLNMPRALDGQCRRIEELLTQLPLAAQSESPAT